MTSHPTEPANGAKMEQQALNAIHEFLGIAQKKIYPQPDKPNSDWAKLKAAVDGLALLYASKPAAREGWKLVPVEPTLEMQYAAIDTGCCTRPTDAYAAMLEAAPAAPAGSGEAVANLVQLRAWTVQLQSLYPEDVSWSSGWQHACKRVIEQIDMMSMQTAAPSPSLPAKAGVTGNGEADRIINRLMSSDPQFDDCADAADLIRSLIAEIRALSGELLAATSSQPAAVVLDDERAAFEAWASQKGWPITGGAVCYTNPTTEKMWEAWQARAASPQAPKGDERANLETLTLLRTFLNAAGGEGLVLGGVDAGDIYMSIFDADGTASHRLFSAEVQAIAFNELFEFQEATGCDTAEEYRAAAPQAGSGLTEITIKQVASRFGAPYEDRIVFYGDRFTEFAEALVDLLSHPTGKAEDAQAREQCINCGLPVDPKCHCERGRAAAQPESGADHD